MLDHGQLGPSTPSQVGIFTPMDSHRRSLNGVQPRRPSIPDLLGSDPNKALTTRSGSSRGSFGETKAGLLDLDGLAGFGHGMLGSLSVSALEVKEGHETEREKKSDPLSVSGLVHPQSLSAQLHVNPTLAALRTTGLSKSTTSSLTLVSAPPILADQRCSGYFVEAVCPHDSTFSFPRLMVLDKMDGTVPGERRNVRKDYLP